MTEPVERYIKDQIEREIICRLWSVFLLLILGFVAEIVHKEYLHPANQRGFIEEEN
jgi:hypothetical protein